MNMKFQHQNKVENRKHADVLAVPFWKLNKGVELACGLPRDLFGMIETAISIEDFKAKEGETLYLYVQGEPEKRICLLGLGSKEKATVEAMRRSYGGLAKSCLDKRLKSVNLIIPEFDKLNYEDLVKGIAEGVLLPNYSFHKYKHREPEEPEPSLVGSITWIGPHPHAVEIAKEVFAVCEGVYFARDLINDNADEITPQYLGKCAKEMAAAYPSVKTTLFDKKRIEKEKMGLFLAVNQGSANDPLFIIMEYRGNPKSSDKTILVGKGVTYDTGGLNLKATGGMETMKCDMAGAAACMGALLAAVKLKLKVNLTVVIPATENSIDAKSFKPGDVFRSLSGKSVEMTNSDAEGRLILADALSYCFKHLNPSRVIDLATLTGAIEVALASEAAGLFSTSDVISKDLIDAGEATFERLWRMPLYEEYKEKLKSDIADIKSWNGRQASSSVAATFLRNFVDEKIPWAHLDIAGTAYVSEAKKYLPKYATGYGVRLIIEFLKRLSEHEGHSNDTIKKKDAAKKKKSSKNS